MNTQRLWDNLSRVHEAKHLSNPAEQAFLHVLSVHAADSIMTEHTHRALAKMLSARKTDEVMDAFDLKIKLR